MGHIAPFDRGYCLAEDLADALAFAPCESARRSVHKADEIMSAIVAKRLVEHLERSGLGRPLTAAQQSDGDNDGGRATKSLPAWRST